MKTPSLVLSLVLALCVSVFSQVPGGMKYQGVARNAFGEVMAEQSIRLRFTVIDSASGDVAYVETHQVTTSRQGLFDLVIGKGTVVSGDYQTIEWITGSKWLKIEMDPTGGTNFFMMGMSEMLTVPFAAVAQTSASDPSSDNEVITEFYFNPAANVLTVTEAGSTSAVMINEEADDLSDNSLTQLGDVDAIPLNGQTLKWNGGKWVAANDETNDQTLSLDDDELSISNGNSIDLSGYMDNTDDQQLFLNPTQNLILLEDGGQIDVTPLVNKGINVSMSFDSVSNVLTITDGTGSMSAHININDSDSDSNPMNEIQMLSITGNLLSISNGNTVTLLDNSSTNELQSLSLSGNTLAISNGNSVTLSDNSSTNELISGFSLTGHILSVTDAGGTTSVDLSGYANDGDADATNEMQHISLTGNTLAISGGNSVTLADNDPVNEIQTLSISNDTISISGGNYITLGVNNDNSASNELNTSAVLTGTMLEITDAGGTLGVDLSALINDADANPTNELNTGAALNGATLEITDAAGTLSVDLSSLEDDADADVTNELQTLSLSNDSLMISSGNSVDLGMYLDNTDNQDLSLSGNALSITNGDTVDLTSFLDNTDNQSLNLAGTDLSISGGNTVSMSAFMDNTDAQTLTYTGDTLSISNGNSVVIEAKDEQTLSLAGTSLSISNGNTVNMGSFLDNTDGQTLSLAGTDLAITGGNTVDLSSFVHTGSTAGGDLTGSYPNPQIAAGAVTSAKILDGTIATGDLANDAVTTAKILDFNVTSAKLGHGSVTTAKIADGNVTDTKIATDAVTNAKIQNGAVTSAKLGSGLTLAGTTTFSGNASMGNNKITNLGAPVAGSDAATKTYVDAAAAPQTLTYTNDTLSISGGNSVVIVANDDQTLSLAGNNLSIADGNSVSLAGYLDNTDAQTLSLAANTLSISGGNNVSLAGYLDNTDAQTLSLAGTTLSIAGGNSVVLVDESITNEIQSLSLAGNTLSISSSNNVSLAGFLDNTDAQTLSLAANTLSISGGNNVSLVSYLDNTDAQTLSLAANTLSISGGNNVSLAGYLDNTDAQNLSLVGNTLSISGGNNVSLAGYLDNTDAQTISYSNDTLYISNGNNVVINSDDDQTLSLVGSNLSIAGGNTVVLGDVSSTNELVTNVTIVNDSLKITDAGGTRTVGKFILSGTAAGGSLTGTYPNPTLVTGAVTQPKIAANAVTTDKIMDRNVQSADLDTNLTLIGQTFINGSQAIKIKNVSSVDDPYLASDEVLILADVTLGAMTVSLPPAATVPNRVYTIKKIDASGFAVTINPDGVETIDGILTPVLTTQYDLIKVVSTGTTWYIIGGE